MTGDVRARRRGEDGFTLIELLIAVAIAGMVAAAILQIFQGSMTQVSQATSLEDAQSSARIGLDQMVTELRQAGSYWNGISNNTAGITAATASAITIMADIDGDTLTGTTEATLTSASTPTTLTVSQNPTAFNTYATSSLNDYAYVANGSTQEVKQVASVAGSVVTLSSSLTNTYPANSIVRSVEKVTYTFDATAKTLTRTVGGAAADPVLDNVTALTFAYFNDTTGQLAASPTDLTKVNEIQISLTTQGTGGGLRTMASRVRLRN